MNVRAIIPGEQIETTLPPKPFLPTPWKWVDPKDVSPREFLYGTHYIREFLSVGFGAPGGGKSTKRMVEAVAMASCRALLGVKPVKKLKVWYWNGEDPQPETDRRFAAICKHYGIKREEIEGWLFTDSGREIPIVMAEQSKTGTRIASPVVEGLKEAIRTAGIDVFIADPFVSCHRVTENDNAAIDAVAKRFSDIAGATGCAIDLEHHIRKTNGNEATVDDGRGASSLVGAARAIEVLNKMTKADAGKLGVEQHWRYLCVDDGKANMAPLGERKWFKLESVLLGNGTELYPDGDSVGVVTNWVPPDLTAGVTGADFDKCADAIRGSKCRADSRAKDWVGKVVAKTLGIALDTKDGRAKVMALLEMWTRSGCLYEEPEYDEKQRKSKKFIRVRDDAEE
jgi:AAA domain